MKTGTSANEIAGYLLWLSANSDPEPVPLTHLHLQKLLYLVQGWSLAEWNTPMFDEEVEAWPDGPVVQEVWKRFEQYPKHKAIDPDEAPPFDHLSPSQLEMVRAVWEAYRGYTGPLLRDMTHTRGPWRKTRRGIGDDAKCKRSIPEADMRSFFKSELSSTQARLRKRRAELFARAEANLAKLNSRQVG
jgi:uncharacterized phage-associated protein